MWAIYFLDWTDYYKKRRRQAWGQFLKITPTENSGIFWSFCRRISIDIWFPHREAGNQQKYPYTTDYGMLDG